MVRFALFLRWGDFFGFFFGISFVDYKLMINFAVNLSADDTRMVVVKPGSVAVKEKWQVKKLFK